MREALLELTRAGLLTPMRNRGFRVIEPTLEDLNDLFDVRETIEVEAATRLAKARTAVSGLRPLADEIAAAVERGDVDAYLDRDREFHREFISLTGNRLMTELAMNLRDNMRLYGISTTRASTARTRRCVSTTNCCGWWKQATPRPSHRSCACTSARGARFFSAGLKKSPGALWSGDLTGFVSKNFRSFFFARSAADATAAARACVSESVTPVAQQRSLAC